MRPHVSLVEDYLAAVMPGLTALRLARLDLSDSTRFFLRHRFRRVILSSVLSSQLSNAISQSQVLRLSLRWSLKRSSFYWCSSFAAKAEMYKFIFVHFCNRSNIHVSVGCFLTVVSALSWTTSSSSHPCITFETRRELIWQSFNPGLVKSYIF